MRALVFLVELYRSHGENIYSRCLWLSVQQSLDYIDVVKEVTNEGRLFYEDGCHICVFSLLEMIY